jgi:AcrR family transcriptional regulator
VSGASLAPADRLGQAGPAAPAGPLEQAEPAAPAGPLEQIEPAAPAGRREQTKLANRAAILDAAREVFAELGYGTTGIRDIVRRTDLAAGTFYNYFPDKESVFRAIVEASAAEIIVRVRTARRRAATLEDFVEGGFRAYFQFVSEDRDTLTLMRRNAGAIRTFFDEPAIGVGSEQLREDLQEAVAAGLAPAHDSEYMAAAMVGAGVELALKMVEREPPDVAGATSMATALFLAGLRHPAHPAAPA